MTGGDELIGDRFGGVDRDCKADALCLHAGLGLASDERVDADDLALEVRQRAAGVARAVKRIGASVWIASSKVGPWV
jgi:hypothetical protein